jgi:chorismate mutase/prephenate dehydratase
MRRITNAIEHTPKLFPQNAVIACQGIEGAYSQLACEKLFNLPSIMYCNTFDSVFAAIDSGLCRYGVLPLENSTAGSINRIYDLMMKYHFSIVRSVRLKVDHNLLAKKGASLKEIKEIFSHEQAITQCAGFLKTLSGVKITACENTAVAAKLVAESQSNRVAALSSRGCADLYGLVCLQDSVQDQGNNYTRFICISKELEIYPGADKTSIMMALPHKPGSLYRILSRFYALGINLIKLESRPIPDRDFEFMFYFDLDTPVYSPQFVQLISELNGVCEEFRYLGSYSEIV